MAQEAVQEASDKVSGGKATLYFQGGLGMVAIEVSSWTVEIAPYAQHKAAVHVAYVKRGARKARAFVQAYDPSLVVIDGWGGPAPDGIWDESTRRGDGVVSTVKGRYMSCDPRWRSDFAATLAAAEVKILADYRTDGRFQRPLT